MKLLIYSINNVNGCGKQSRGRMPRALMKSYTKSKILGLVRSHIRGRMITTNEASGTNHLR